MTTSSTIIELQSLFRSSSARTKHRPHAFCRSDDHEDPSREVVAVTDQDGKEVATAELKDWMYVGEDGLLRTFEGLSGAEQTKVNQDEDFFHPDYIGKGCFDVLYSTFQWEEEVEHHDAGNEGGGRTTWYRSAALVFKPAAKSGDSE